MKSRLLNINIDLFDEESFLTQLEKDLSNKKTEVFFLNAHCFNLAQQDEKYLEVINSCDYLLNDGIGIKLASLFDGVKIKQNLNGTDLIPKIIALAAKKKQKVFLLGAEEGVAKLAAENLLKNNQGLEIAGVHNGYEFGDDLLKEIDDSRAEILLVAMGVPTQEIWIRENKDKLKNVKLFVAGGAILDFLSGRIKRAPVLLRKMSLEWVFRLILEPARLWKRYIIGNILFFYYVFALKIWCEKAVTE